MSTWKICVLVALGLGIFCLVDQRLVRPDYHAQRNEKLFLEKEARRQYLHAHPELKMSIDTASWAADGPGSLLFGDFTIQNDNETAVRDIQISCETKGDRGAAPNAMAPMILERIESKKARTFRGVLGGVKNQRSGVPNCTITGATRG